MAQSGHAWTQVRPVWWAFGVQVGPKTGPMWATWPRTNPAKAKKMLEKRKFFKSAKSRSGWAQLGTGLPQRSPTGAALFWAQVDVGATWSCSAEVVKPCDARGRPGHATFRFTPHSHWAQRRHNIGNIASHEASSVAKNAENISDIGVPRISDWAGYVPPFDPIWTSTWVEVAPKRVQVGARLRRLGKQVKPKLEPSGSKGGSRGLAGQG